MSTKYLDYNGLLYFWGKLKNYFQAKLVSGTNIKTVNGSSLLGSGNISIGGDSTQTLSPTISVSTGTLVSSSCKRYGNVIELILSVKNTASIASGSNIFVATVSGIPLPSQQLRGATFYGARILGFAMSSAGAVNLSNTYTAAVSGATTDIHFVYIVS